MGSINRRPWETATVLNQELLNLSQDSLTQGLETIVEVETATGIEYWSDRAKYVAGRFYENRVEFPEITRTVGEFLAGELEFSDLELTVNNTDKKYSDRLQGGVNFDGWIGRRLEVKIGLGEIENSYITVFEGFVTDTGGYSRDTSTFKLRCRNKFDSVNVTLPNQVLIEDDFPNIEDEFIGLAAPIIYGDWTTSIRSEAPAVPAFPVNGLDPLVSASLDPVDPNAGDNPLRLVISSTPLKSIDTASVTLFRGDKYHKFDSSDITILAGTDNTIIDVTQKNLLVKEEPTDTGIPFIYESGDEFYLKCNGVDLGAYDNNIVAQARDVLERFGGINSSDFTSAWDTYKNKTSPAESAIANIPSRVWLQETNKAIELVAALLEQVRVEPFINRQNAWDLTSLHFDTFEVNPNFSIKNWDVSQGSFNPSLDDRNNFNRAKADFDFDPSKGESRLSTALFRNQAAIDQAGKEISKLITFPNLYKIADVENQLKEIIKLVSAYSEMADVTISSRAFLKDIGDFVRLSIDIGSIEFSATGQPIVGMIRDLTYEPKTLGISTRIWMFQMVNFPGYTGPSGTVGGFDATITKET